MSRNLKVTLIAIGLGFLVGTIVALLTGVNPLNIFSALLQSFTGIDLLYGAPFNPRYIGEFLVAATPIIFTGLGIAFAFRTGLFNIGAEGQFIMGSVSALAAALLLPAGLPWVVHVLLCLLAAIVVGGIWGGIPGLLKAKFNIHEVVVTIMMNYIALYSSNLIIKAMPGFANEKTAEIPASASLHSDFLSQLTGGSRLNLSIFILMFAIFFFWFIVEKTSFGYRLRAIGHNKEAARYAGMKVESGIVMSMAISGAFAALGGACMALGTFGYGSILAGFENYGFDGIAVALVGANHAIGVLFSGLLFGMLNSAQPLMQTLGIPRDIAVIISASIIFFVAMVKGIEMVLDKVEAKKKRKTTKEAK